MELREACFEDASRDDLTGFRDACNKPWLHLNNWAY